MFKKCIGMKFDEVEKMVSQLGGLTESYQIDGQILYTSSPNGWFSDTVYEFLFEKDICVEIEVHASPLFE
jgi:hypothetical protein